VKRHRYYLLNRPPGVACQPKGDVAREVWFPPKPMPGQEDRRVLGWVEYDHALTHEEIWQWELAPADIGEQANHVFWMETRGDDDPDWLKNDYMSQPANDLMRLYQECDDHLAWAALFLKGIIST